MESPVPTYPPLQAKWLLCIGWLGPWPLSNLCLLCPCSQSNSHGGTVPDFWRALGGLASWWDSAQWMLGLVIEMRIVALMLWGRTATGLLFALCATWALITICIWLCPVGVWWWPDFPSYFVGASHLQLPWSQSVVRIFAFPTWKPSGCSLARRGAVPFGFGGRCPRPWCPSEQLLSGVVQNLWPVCPMRCSPLQSLGESCAHVGVLGLPTCPPVSSLLLVTFTLFPMSTTLQFFLFVSIL